VVGVINYRCDKNGGKWVGVVLAERGSGKVGTLMMGGWTWCTCRLGLSYDEQQ
jgi:ABC-type ATPase with predicted acetyltransferase domain